MAVRSLVGAALGAVLLGILPASAGADGRSDARFGSVRDYGIWSHSGDSVPGRGFDGPQERGRFDLREPPSPQFRHARQELRRFLRISAQKHGCHPPVKPPHGHHFGPDGYAFVGFFPGPPFGDRDDHGEHHGHHGHKPPTCPSPH